MLFGKKKYKMLQFLILIRLGWWNVGKYKEKNKKKKSRKYDVYI